MKKEKFDRSLFKATEINPETGMIIGEEALEKYLDEHTVDEIDHFEEPILETPITKKKAVHRKEGLDKLSSDIVEKVFTSLNFGEIKKRLDIIPMPSPLFDCLFNEGDVVVLFGPTGVGKSTFAFQMANCIARGQTDDAFDCFDIDNKPRKVGYLDFELGLSNIKSRYYNMDSETLHFGIDEHNLNYITVDSLAYLNVLGDSNKNLDRVIRALELIRKLCSEEQLEVLIIDNITDISEQLEDAKDAAPFMKRVVAMAKDLGITLIMLAHTHKVGDQAPIELNQLKGSSSIAQALDAIIGIKRTSGGSVLYIKQLKHRNTSLMYGPENVCCMELRNDNDGKWLHFAGYSPEEEILQGLGDTTMRGPTNDILFRAYWLRKEKKLSLSDAAEELGCSHTSISSYCKKVERDPILKFKYSRWLDALEREDSN